MAVILSPCFIYHEINTALVLYKLNDYVNELCFYDFYVKRLIGATSKLLFDDQFRKG